MSFSVTTPTNILYIDIETIPNDPVAAEADGVKDKQALSALTGSVALIGIAHNEGPVTLLTDADGEEAMLRKFWDIVWAALQKGELIIVGHNISGFDGPFLVRRSWKYGIKVPNVFVKDLYGFKQERWVDTMKIWTFFSKTDRISLKSLCDFFGIPVKTSEVEGKDFYKWWAKDKEKCKEYCREDVAATRSAYKRLILT